MRILVVAAGSRGDVQPLVALGAGLAGAGHEVTVCASAEFEVTAGRAGLGFIPSAVSVEEQLHSEPGLDWLGHSSHSPFAELRALRRLADAAAEGYADTLEGLVGLADLYVSGILTCDGVDLLTRAGGGDHVVAALSPLQPSAAGWACLQPPFPGRTSVVNRVVSGLTAWFAADVFSVAADAFAERIGAPPPGRAGYLRTLRRTPTLLAVSPSVLPPPPDWTDVEVTGYWFDAASDHTPDPELAEFLDAGPAPAYVGFGSMTTRDVDATVDVVRRAASRTGRRVLLHSGAAGLGGGPGRLDDRVLVVGSVPHDWLLPRTCGVVHHGGAGTTAAALRAGVPSVAVPHIGDQPYWGRRLHELGVGPAPVPRHLFDVDRLAALLTALPEPGHRETAARIATRIAAEDGVARAVDWLAAR